MTEKLQEDLKSSFGDWLMEFHPDKCSVISITRKKTIQRYPCTLHGQILIEETNIKYLRVTIADMTWKTDIEQTAANLKGK